MTDKQFLHERIARGEEAMKKFAEFSLTFCGVGAIGSNLAMNLARQGFVKLFAIDFDRVEEHNIGTQAYHFGLIGMPKVDALDNLLYQIMRVPLEKSQRELDSINAEGLLRNSNLVIDSFDNSASRKEVKKACHAVGVRCLHVGLYEDYGEVVWNENYQVPEATGLDVCDYPLFRDIIILTVIVASEVVIDFVLNGKKTNYSITLRDLHIEKMEG